MAGREPLAELRLDKWLWAARFFKTRAAATAAIGGGKVHVNGQRVKPARTVRPGDRLEILRGEARYAVVVQALNDQRRPAAEAAGLYEETPESLAKREALAEMPVVVGDWMELSVADSIKCCLNGTAILQGWVGRNSRSCCAAVSEKR